MKCPYKSKRKMIKRKARKLARNIKEYFEIDREQAMKLRPRLPMRIYR